MYPESHAEAMARIAGGEALLFGMVAAKDAEISRLTAENSRLLDQRDRIDCEVREGNGTYHCALDNKCDACLMRGEIRRLKERASEYANALTYIENAVPDGIALVARALTAGRGR
jgi:hypothetical protein